MEYSTTNLTKYYPTSFHCINLELCFYWSCAYCASKFGGLCSDLLLQIHANSTTCTLLRVLQWSVAVWMLACLYWHWENIPFWWKSGSDNASNYWRMNSYGAQRICSIGPFAFFVFFSFLFKPQTVSSRKVSQTINSFGTHM